MLVQAEQAGRAIQQMQSAEGRMTRVMDAVSAVVDENISAARRIAVEAGVVQQAIEAIASISEENSASVEEVLASTEEMSSQVAETAQSAEDLEQMTNDLQKVVARFRLEEDREGSLQPGF